MPCLNEAETLRTCILKAQKAFNEANVVGEVIIADNGSTDGSVEIANRLGTIAGQTDTLLASAEELAASGEEQSASTEEIASSANQLAEAADRLTGAVKSFRLLSDEVQQAAD